MSVNDPRVRLQHMLDAAREVVQFTSGRERADLDNDQMLLRALSMSTGIIGEAASQLDEAICSKYPDVPWRQIIGMRNFLFHEYFRVDANILWATAKKAVPPLIPQLEQILADLNSDNDES